MPVDSRENQRRTSKSPYVRLMFGASPLPRVMKRKACGLSVRSTNKVHSDAIVLNRLGELFIKVNRWDDAERVLRRSLDVLEENPVALNGVAQVSLELGKNQVAAESALLAVGLFHYFPAAHFHLGEALVELGRETDAIAAYETCLGMGYEPGTTHGRLAALYRLRNPVLAKHHENCSYNL